MVPLKDLEKKAIQLSSASEKSEAFFVNIPVNNYISICQILLFNFTVLYSNIYICNYMNTEKTHQFRDIPTNKEWWCRFDVLNLPEQHRKILNRQPEIESVMIEFVFFIFRDKIMSN